MARRVAPSSTGAGRGQRLLFLGLRSEARNDLDRAAALYERVAAALDGDTPPGLVRASLRRGAAGGRTRLARSCADILLDPTRLERMERLLGVRPKISLDEGIRRVSASTRARLRERGNTTPGEVYEAASGPS